MIVDDERDVVTLIKFLLERDGHNILEAHNGAEALEKLGVEPKKEGSPLPDLMIVDVMMPLMDGFSLSTRLSEDPRTSNIPILILTAKGEMRELFKPASNVKSYIEKPFDPKTLRETVSRTLPPSPAE